MPRKSTEPFKYAGFPSPNGTVVPDDLFDVLMPELSEAELRVLLYIVRRTFGFKKDSDAISLSQMVDGMTTRDGRVLDRGTGMSRRGVMKGCAGLIEKGVIRVDKRLSEQGDNEINVYHLRFQGEAEPVGTAVQGVGNDVPYRREQGAPRVGNKVPPQQTVKQQTERQDSKIRIDLHNDVERDNPTRASLRAQKTLHKSPRRPGEIEATGTIVQELPLAEAVARWQQRRRDVGSQEPGKQTNGSEATSRTGEEASGRRRVTARPRQVAQQDEAYQVIQAYVADFGRELNDRAPLRSSTTRAYNLYRRSGLDLNAFVAQLYAARAIVKERAAAIRTQGGENRAGFAVKHRAGYYFAVLEDLLGLREPSPASPPPPRSTT